jgi:VWFA-related protein
MRFALGIFAALALGLATVGARAQQPQVSSVVVAGVQSEMTTGTASVTVLDAAGNPVEGLGQGAFSVKVDGKDAKVSAVSSGLDEALPLGLVLTVDTSGSMADGGALEAAKAAMNQLAQSLQPTDRAALMIFAEGVQTIVEPTSDKSQLSLYLSGLTPKGNTALYAAISGASTLATKMSEPRKAIVLLSDGQDFGNVSGGVTRDAALGAAQLSGVPFFVVALGNQVDTPFLTDLSKPAGGQLLTAATPQELAALYSRIAQRLRVQYTVKFDLSGELTAGDHDVVVTAGGQAGNAILKIGGETTAGGVGFSGLTGELREKTTVSLTNLASSVQVAWQIDGGVSTSAAGDPRAIELDPYLFAPNTTHTLTAVYDPNDPTKKAETTFKVPALAPRVVSPTTLPNLAPNDKVILTIQAQTGVEATAIYLVDGEEVERDTQQPYQFTLPLKDYPHGDHALTVRLEAGGQSSETSYGFEGAPGASTNYAAYGIIALCALAVLAIMGYGGRLAFARFQNRERPADLSNVAASLEGWARDRRGADGERKPERPPVPVAPPPPGAWGAFTVIDGDKRGARFALEDDTELVGRGKFCSVRLKDKGIEDAHFVVTNEGVIHASTPACRIEVDGADVRLSRLRDGSTIRVGRTLLRFTTGEQRAPAEAPQASHLKGGRRGCRDKKSEVSNP